MTPVPDSARTRLDRRHRWLSVGSGLLVIVGVGLLGSALTQRDDRVVLGQRWSGQEATAQDRGLARGGRLDLGVGTPGDLDGSRAVRLVLCLRTDRDQDELTAALDGLVARWVRRSDGEEIARQPLSELERAPRHGAGLRCAELPEITVAGEDALAVEVEDPATVEAGEGKGSDRLGWLAASSPRGLLVDGMPVRWTERLACLLLLAAMALRLLVWQTTASPTAGPARWRPYDAFVGVIVLLLLGAALGAALGGAQPTAVELLAHAEKQTRHDAGVYALSWGGQRMLVALVLNVGLYLALSWAMARWRSRHPSAALGIAPVSGRQLGGALLGGLLLAAGATALLAIFKPDEPSTMQWLTAVPGTMLVTAAIASMSPWYEEVFFRGFLFGAVEGVAGRVVAALVSGGLFALAHVSQHSGYLVPLVPILAVATATTALRLRSGSTTPAFALHLGYNALLVLPAILAPGL